MSDELTKMADRLEQLKSEIDVQSAWLDIISEKVAIAEKLLELLAKEAVLRVEVSSDRQ